METARDLDEGDVSPNRELVLDIRRWRLEDDCRRTGAARRRLQGSATAGGGGWSAAAGLEAAGLLRLRGHQCKLGRKESSKTLDAAYNLVYSRHRTQYICLRSGRESIVAVPMGNCALHYGIISGTNQIPNRCNLVLCESP